MKICHLQLTNGMGKNPETLVCRLDEGAINYIYYRSHTSGGTPLALSNLQCDLPIEKLNDAETKREFTERLVDVINVQSVRQVVNQVEEVSFDE
jgi:hypothetical protein